MEALNGVLDALKTVSFGDLFDVFKGLADNGSDLANVLGSISSAIKGVFEAFNGGGFEGIIDTITGLFS